MDNVYTIDNYITKLVNIIKDREKELDEIISVENINTTSQIKFAEELTTLRTVIRDLKLMKGDTTLYSYWNE